MGVVLNRLLWEDASALCCELKICTVDVPDERRVCERGSWGGVTLFTAAWQVPLRMVMC